MHCGVCDRWCHRELLGLEALAQAWPCAAAAAAYLIVWVSLLKWHHPPATASTPHIRLSSCRVPPQPVRAQIHGPTPSNLLQDKLGEYRRVQLRVITERGVYEMVGMPNVMMW